MTQLSFRKASEMFDVSRPTLSKARKSGKITAVKDDQGTWLVEESELARVYQRRVPTHKKNADNLSTENTVLHGGVQASEQAEIDVLKAQLAEAEKRAAVAEALAAERADRIEDLRRMLPGPGTPTRRRWWPWSD